MCIKLNRPKTHESYHSFQIIVHTITLFVCIKLLVGYHKKGYLDQGNKLKTQRTKQIIRNRQGTDPKSSDS
jgi:hypothetical protein